MADEKAAFGVYPHLKAKRSKQNAEAAKNVPIDLARGAISGALGMPADIINLGGALASGLTGKDIPEVPFGSEYIEKRLPLRSDTPVSRAATTIGQLAGGADLGPLTKAAKGTAKAIAPKAADLLEQHMLNQGLMLPVVKPKGGNWIDSGLKIGLKDLKRSGSITPENIALAQKQADEVRQAGDEAYAQAIEQNILNAKRNNALNEWIDRNLTNYIKKEMGTPEDPVRKLAEQGISHIPEANLVNRYGDMMIRRQREKAGFPEMGMGESPMAKGWENISDALIQSQKPGEVRPLTKEANPWINKLDPNENIYGYDYNRSANFSHIMDVLREDLASGRIRPDQLNKVSMEQAVRRTHEYDQEMARKMQEAKLRSFETMPVHKEYPEGYKWIELALPKVELEPGHVMGKPSGYPDLHAIINEATGQSVSFGATPEEALKLYKREERKKVLEDALKYEGDTMGHCVGGYCPDVMEGRSRIFSLRDKKGEPHVTVETQPGPHPVSTSRRGDNFPEFTGFEYGSKYSAPSPYNPTKEQLQQIHNRAQELWSTQGTGRASDVDKFYQEASNEILGKMPERIIQIKGKQNRAPVEEYLPFVQDFVRSGKWSDVGDIQNTGMRATKDIFSEAELQKLRELGEADLPHIMAGEDIQRYHNLIVPEGQRLKYDARGNIIGREGDEGLKAGGAVHLTDNPDAMRMELDDQHYMAGGLSKAAREAFAKIAPIKQEIAAKAAEQAKYAKDTAHIPTQDLHSFEQWKATQPNVSPEELENMRKDMGLATGGSVGFTDNNDAMRMELDQHMAGGGLAEKLAKLLRAPAKSKAEIEAIAERMAPQVTGEFVRGEKGTQSVAGKTQKQFAREKEIQHDIRPTGAEPPVVPKLDYEKLKGNVMVGIAGDPTITGKSIHAVAGQPLQSPSPQHGGPLYGLGHDKDHFWASQLGAARRVQNLAKEAGEQYDAPVMGKYIMMGPDSINYAQHYADANLSAIDLSKMRKSDIEGFNKLIRQGSPASGPRPSFPGIENPEEAYLYFSVDPESRKHFNALMQMPTVTERFNLPSGIDVRHAVTEPELRNLETGVTGFSVGRMRPEVSATELKWSEHPTYSHDIPGEFMGQTNYPIPYELSFPDTLKAIRENPKQAPHEFGSLKMVGPRQIIDQQMIDEIKRYEETMKKLTGKKKGGAVTASGLIEVKRKKRK